MRFAAVWFAGLIGSLAASAQSPWSKLERTPLLDSDYVRLSEWDSAFNSQIHCMRRSAEVQLTNAWPVFTADSQRAEINGVTVVLSAPVLARNGIGRVE